jgi:hypothetical protein
MPQTSSATKTAAQLASARKTMQALSPTSPVRARQERLIDNLKASPQNCR